MFEYKLIRYYGDEIITHWKVKTFNVLNYCKRLRPCMPLSLIEVYAAADNTLLYIITARYGAKPVQNNNF